MTTSIAVEQHAEALFELPASRVSNAPFLLDAAESVVIPPQPAPLALGKLVSGYALVRFLGFSDQPMSLLVEEGNEPSGPFAAVATYTSAVIAGQNVLKQNHAPSGSFMRVTLMNTGVAAESSLSFKGIGVPVS